jgi:hypothetical protein
MGQVYWSWQADLQPGELENFKGLVRRWNAIAEADEDTLHNDWVISEEETSVRVDQRFTNASAAMAQFQVNRCWGELDNHLIPTAMHVCGDYGTGVDFLREHGATFMQPLI